MIRVNTKSQLKVNKKPNKFKDLKYDARSMRMNPHYRCIKYYKGRSRWLSKCILPKFGNRYYSPKIFDSLKQDINKGKVVVNNTSINRKVLPCQKKKADTRVSFVKRRDTTDL